MNILCLNMYLFLINVRQYNITINRMYGIVIVDKKKITIPTIVFIHYLLSVNINVIHYIANFAKRK